MASTASSGAVTPPPQTTLHTLPLQGAAAGVGATASELRHEEQAEEEDEAQPGGEEEGGEAAQRGEIGARLGTQVGPDPDPDPDPNPNPNPSPNPTSTLKPEKRSSPDATSGGWKAGEPRLLEHVSASVYLVRVRVRVSRGWQPGTTSVTVRQYLSSASETPKSEILRMPSTLTMRLDGLMSRCTMP